MLQIQETYCQSSFMCTLLISVLSKLVRHVVQLSLPFWESVLFSELIEALAPSIMVCLTIEDEG